MQTKATDVSGLAFLKSDIIEKLGVPTWDVAELLMHGYGKRQISKLLNVSYLEVKQHIENLRDFLERSHYSG